MNKYNVVLREGFVTNVMVDTDLEFVDFVGNVRFDRGVWADKNTRFIPIENIAIIETKR